MIRGREVVDPSDALSGARRAGVRHMPVETIDAGMGRWIVAAVGITVVAFSVILDGALSWLVAALLGGGVLLAARSAAGPAWPVVVIPGSAGVLWRSMVGRLAGL